MTPDPDATPQVAPEPPAGAPPTSKAGWTNDIAASVVVALVALPLCLGIALASGAPLFSGLIAGIVGGLVVGALSGSQLSVSGPAAGLTVIVLGAIESLPSWEAFLLAVVLAGVLQLGIWLSRAAVLSEFIPSSVITGMLAAIGLILILKQFPHAIGYDGVFEGSEAFLQRDGSNTFTTLLTAVSSEVLWGAVLISVLSLAFLFWWDAARPKKGPLRLLPGPLVVVVAGVVFNALFMAAAPSLVLEQTHLVSVPIADGVGGFIDLFAFPDFGQVGNADVWVVAGTLALVATLETLLCINAVDQIDPRRRVSDKNREMMAQGAGNMVSGLIGGLPLTSVIVRSSANVDAGGETRRSAILHGGWLLGSVVLIPAILNLIPLASLAAVLLFVGYKLTRLELYVARFKQGWTQFIPFIVTVVAILLTDLLVGIFIGLAVGFVFVVGRNFRPAVTYQCDGEDCLVRARRNLYFIHKHELKSTLAKVPNGANVLIDLSQTNFVDLDNVDVINGFVEGARWRDIDVTLRGDFANNTAPLINAPKAGAQYA